MTIEPTYVSADLSACTDCLVLIANGETDPALTEDETAEYVDRVQANWPDYQWLLTTGAVDCEHCSYPDGEEQTDCEPWFSRSSCDVCHSPLGGDRHHVTASPLTLEAAGLDSVDQALAKLDNYAHQYTKLSRAHDELEELQQDYQLELEGAAESYARQPERAAEILRTLITDTIGLTAAPLAITTATPANAAEYMSKGETT